MTPIAKNQQSLGVCVCFLRLFFGSSIALNDNMALGRSTSAVVRLSPSMSPSLLLLRLLPGLSSSSLLLLGECGNRSFLFGSSHGPKSRTPDRSTSAVTRRCPVCVCVSICPPPPAHVYASTSPQLRCDPETGRLRRVMAGSSTDRWAHYKTRKK